MCFHVQTEVDQLYFSYRCCVRSRQTVQRSNRCLFVGLPPLTFSEGKNAQHKNTVIPQMTSGWSTEVSTILNTVPSSGEHTILRFHKKHQHYHNQ